MIKKLIFYCTLCSFLHLNAQDGSANSAFGNSGLVELDISEYETVQSLLELNNGNLLVIGTFYSNNSNVKYLLQYTEAGNLVTSYGDNGVLALSEEFNDARNLLFVQPDDKIVLSAFSNYQFQLKRINSNSEVDATFGADGILVPIPESSIIGKVAELDDGSFMVASRVDSSPTPQLFVRKFFENGDLDVSFGNGNTNYTQINPLSAVTSIDTNTEGFVIVTCGTIGSQNIALRFSPDGTLDTTFGKNGVVILPSSGASTRCVAKINNSDEIIVSCSFPNDPNTTNDDFSSNSKLYKLLINGELDTTFNGVGQRSIESYSVNYSGNLIIQPNQKILFIAVGNFGFEGGLTLNMLRFTSDGYLDTSFNFQTITGEYGGLDSLLHSNGTIMVAGDKIWYEEPINILLTNYNNSPLGIIEETHNTFSVIPNPSNGIFNIDITSIPSNNLSFCVYDLRGRIILEGVFQNQVNQLDLSQYESGIYLLKHKNSFLRLVKD